MGSARGTPHAARSIATLACGLLAALGAAACGDDSAAPSGPTVTQRVTRDFGRELLADASRTPLEGHGTVLRLLREHADAETSAIGGAVESIDGLRRREPGPGVEETTWALNVNGIEADERPSRYRLFPGDVVQWDYRDWYVTLDVRATVGAFPATFTRGVFGRRFPVTVECERPASDPCRHVEDVLADAGVATDGSRPPGGRPPRGQPQRAKVLVGRWDRWRRRPWPARIDAGPRYSGVFARFTPDGSGLRLFDWNAHPGRLAMEGTGLIAAMRPTEEDLLWVVTGVDAAGVRNAALALDARSLRDAFAVVVTPSGVEKIPLPPAG